MTESKLYNFIRATFLILMLIMAYFQFKYRFKHPHMTETELFINLFEAFK